MSPAVPKGTPIGRIETSLDWLLSHTTRFQGAIIVRVSGGKGLILIEYGRPAAFLFNLGERTLLGTAAWRFFAQHELLHTSLHRYTDQEFRVAMALMAPGARIPDNGKEAAEVPRPTSQHEERYGAGGSSQDLIRESATRHPDPVEHEAAEVRRPTSQHEERYGAGGSSQDLIRESATRHQDPVERKYPGATGSPGTVSAFAVPDRGSTLEGILGRFLEVPGVGAVAFFREGSIVASLGDRALEDLVEPAEEVLLSAFEVLPLLSSGSLVQVTVQLFGHNITITPYNDGYLLIQTYPEINLGQIRKLAQCINREPGYGMG